MTNEQRAIDFMDSFVATFNQSIGAPPVSRLVTLLYEAETRGMECADVMVRAMLDSERTAETKAMTVYLVVGEGHAIHAACATREVAFAEAAKLKGGEAAYGVEDWVVIGWADEQGRTGARGRAEVQAQLDDAIAALRFWMPNHVLVAAYDARAAAKKGG